MSQNLGGNIVLEGFDLDSQEMVIVRKVVGNYAKRIKTLANYEELKIDMKSHSKGNSKLFEIKALLIFDGERANSESQGRNPFVLIDAVLKKILNETEKIVKK